MKVNNEPVVYGNTNSVARIIMGFSYKNVHHEDIESIYNCEALPQTIFNEEGMLMFGAQLSSGNQVIGEGLIMGEERDE